MPRFAVGIVIGRNGEMIKKIQNDAGVRIQFKPGVCTVYRKMDCVCVCLCRKVDCVCMWRLGIWGRHSAKLSIVSCPSITKATICVCLCVCKAVLNIYCIYLWPSYQSLLISSSVCVNPASPWATTGGFQDLPGKQGLSRLFLALWLHHA